MWNWIDKLNELVKTGAPFVIVTITRVSGSTPQNTGAKMLVNHNGDCWGSIGGGQLEKKAIEDALECINERKSKTMHYPLHAAVNQCCGGIVELLFELIGENPELYIFGAGHVGAALCKTLKDTPFRICLIDERKELLESIALSKNIKIFNNYLEFINTATWDTNKTYTAIITHDHDLDRLILNAVLDKPQKYLGMIGSQTKWKVFQKELIEKRRDINHINRVICPMGLDIGGKSPKEIAISMSAELIKVYYGK
ncbi:MAG: xanthine dehydrogenase accessory protein XdhC [Bdellovibrio sp.]|nr:xanthine dehydrogenase accessory protein XdhC [Bdellovibrio sp.]